MLHPVEALFCDSVDNLSILHDSSGGIGMKHVEAEDQHGEPDFFRSVMLFVFTAPFLTIPPSNRARRGRA
jgi:hypothetical protein